MKKTLFICATALLVASCSKDTTETPEAKPQGIIFSAAEENDTRTKLDGVNILWQRDDAVGIFSPQIAEAVNYKAVITEEDHDKQFALLRTDLNFGSSDVHAFYAYYPYVEGQTAAATVNGSISASQNGEIGSNAFMWAKASVDPAANPRVDLHFKHPFAYLNIQLNATGEYNGATVERIRLEAAEGKTLAGDYEADLVNNTVTFTTHERIVTVTPAAAALGEVYQNTLVVVNAEDLAGTELVVSITLRQNDKAVKLRNVIAGRLLKPQTKINLKLAVDEMGIDEIGFTDEKVKTICLEHWDTDGDGRLSYEEAAAVQSLGNVFQGTDISSFDELKLFKGLTSIGDNEFRECRNMRSVTIPENVTSIGQYAFEKTGLTNITIPEHITSIGRYPFFSCKNLTYFSTGNKIEKIPEGCVAGCSNLTQVNIGTSVKSIGPSAFEKTGLTSIVIPDKVTTLGHNAFSDCFQLADVTIGYGIETISADCFMFCYRLNSIEIGPSVKFIGSSAFSHSGLTSIVIPDKVTIYSNAFCGCHQLTEVTIGNGIETIPDSCFRDCVSLKNIVFGTGVKSIGEFAFRGCSSLTNIVIPDNVTTIGYQVFYESGLTSIVIPDKVTTLGSYAFYNCYQLADVKIGNGIETIPSTCFFNCISLKSIEIGSGIKSIGDQAFQRCSSLTDVYCRALTPPACGENAFSEVNSTINLYVPTESVDSYRAADGWKDFTNISGYDYGNL